MIPIVIPLHPRGGKFGDNTELRLTLRSLERHFQEPFEITIVSAVLPEWLTGVRHLPCDGGLKSALLTAANAFPDGFFWYYDDCPALRDTTAAEMMVTAACKGWRRNHNTGWSRKLDSIRERLEREGRPAFDYSRPHGPYWFDKGMIDEAFSDWPGMAGKFPFESWILSKRDWPRRHGVVKQYYGPFREAPAAHHWFLNYCDGGLTDELLGYLRKRFRRPSRFEADHPIAWPQELKRVEVHTIRWGDAWWIKECAGTLDAWCVERGHRLRVWAKEDIDPTYPAEKFCEVDMLREFLAGDAEWLLYVDADVYVDPIAPPHPPFDGLSGFLIAPDRPGRFSRQWPGWVRRRFGDGEGLRHGWTYRNAGVWACDRDGARRMLETIREPFRNGCQEQHHWNWWLCQAAAAGMPVHFLPEGWNSFPHVEGKAAFYHICGRKKAKKFNCLVARGLIQRTAIHPTMKTFDDAPFRFARHDNGWDTGDLHIHALHVAAGLDTGRPGSERIAVEVGAFRGRSTAALVAALHKGFIGHLHVVELRPTASLKQVIAMAPAGTVTLHAKPFWDLDIGPADLVFIDGDHKWPAVGDTLRALSWGVKVLAMHDTHSWPRISGTWGSKLAGQMVRDFPGREWIEDAEERDGQRTFRGFLVSVEQGIDLDPLRDYYRQAAGHTLADDEPGSGQDDADDEIEDEEEDEAVPV